MSSFFRDLVFGVRLLLKSPGFTIVAVLSLAVGIGVTSTVFGFVNAVFFRSISVSNSDGLVYVVEGNRGKPFRPTSWSKYQEFSKQNEVLSGLAAYAAPPMLMTRGDQTEEVSAEVVSGNFFSVLDVRLQLGQSFAPLDDELAVSPPSVVISDRLWKRRLNSEPTLVGKQLVLNGTSFTVVGIAPETFIGTDPTVSTDVWIPITQWAAIVEKKTDKTVEEPETQPTSKESGRLGRDHNWLQMIGRLKSGMTAAQAQAAMTTIAQRLETNQRIQDARVTLSPVSAVHPEIAQEMPTGIIIIAVTGVILMICCVNVASLMLARAAVRRKEFAVRLALGSTRARLVRQLMTEALVLSLIGGMLGFIFGYWMTRAVLGLLPPADLGFTARVAIDQRVLLFSFFISLLTTVFFGLLPALNSVRSDLLHSLAADSMALGIGKRKINLRRALVVVQIVASFVLLIGSGIFLRSFQSGQSLSSSFRSNRILVLNLSPRKYGYATNYNRAFYRNLLNRIGAMPGVESVTVSNVVPLTIEQDNVSVRAGNRESIRLRRSIVGSGYFETLNIPIVLGRGFTDDDASRRVAIVNEAMVRALWPDETPLGKTLNSGPGLTYEIIGVAKDSPYNNLGRASEPYLYLSLYQRETDAVSLIIRTSVEPKSMIAGVQREIKELGGDLPIFDFKTLDELAKGQLRAVKAAAGLLGLLSFIGILVAAIGIYGVTSYAFNQRRREIGIRMSLGAQRTDVLKLIMKEGIALALIGIIIGALLAAGMMYFISSLLFGVSTIDPLVFVVVAALLSLVAIGASLVPGMMAAKSDPVEALRHE